MMVFFLKVDASGKVLDSKLLGGQVEHPDKNKGEPLFEFGPEH